MVAGLVWGSFLWSYSGAPLFHRQKFGIPLGLSHPLVKNWCSALRQLGTVLMIVGSASQILVGGVPLQGSLLRGSLQRSSGSHRFHGAQKRLFFEGFHPGAMSDS